MSPGIGETKSEWSAYLSQWRGRGLQPSLQSCLWKSLAKAPWSHYQNLTELTVHYRENETGEESTACHYQATQVPGEGRSEGEDHT